MTTQITTNVKTNVIKLMDGAKIYCTEQEAERLLQLSSTNVRHFRIGERVINFSSVSSIMPVKDYQEAHGEYEQRTEQPFEANRFLPRKPVKRERAMKAMIKGMEDYIASNKYQGTQKPVELLKNMNKRLKEIRTPA